MTTPSPTPAPSVTISELPTSGQITGPEAMAVDQIQNGEIVTVQTTAAAIAALNAPAIQANTTAIANLETQVQGIQSGSVLFTGAGLLGTVLTVTAVNGVLPLIVGQGIAGCTVTAGSPGVLVINDPRLVSTAAIFPATSGLNTIQSALFAGSLSAYISTPGTCIISSTSPTDVQLAAFTVNQGPSFSGTVPTTVVPSYAWYFGNAAVTLNGSAVTGISGVPIDYMPERGSNAWAIGPSGTRIMYPAGFPRISWRHNFSGKFAGTPYVTGLMLERGATQLLQFPTAPQVESPLLALGTYVLWCDGLGNQGGSATVVPASTNPATFTMTQYTVSAGAISAVPVTSGPGVATAGTGTMAAQLGHGTWVTLVVTVAGNITVTPSSGPAPSGVQLESNGQIWPTSFIPVGGYTRAPEWGIAPMPDQFVQGYLASQAGFQSTNSSGAVQPPFTLATTFVAGEAAVLNPVRSGVLTITDGNANYAALSIYAGQSHFNNGASISFDTLQAGQIYNFCAPMDSSTANQYVGVNGTTALLSQAGASSVTAANTIVFGNWTANAAEPWNDFLDGEMVFASIFNQTFTQRQVAAYSSIPAYAFPDPLPFIPQINATRVTQSNCLYGLVYPGVPQGPIGSDVFEVALGRPLDYTTEYVDSGTFNPPISLNGYPGFLSIAGSAIGDWNQDGPGGSRRTLPWATNDTYGNTNRNMLWSVPLLGHQDQVAPSSTYTTLLAGDFDPLFVSVFNNIKQYWPSAITRLGWEFNGGGTYGDYNWKIQWYGAGNTFVGFANVFNRVAQIAKGISPGFTIDWCLCIQAAGEATCDALSAWPGAIFQGYVVGNILTVTEIDSRYLGIVCAQSFAAQVANKTGSNFPAMSAINSPGETLRCAGVIPGTTVFQQLTGSVAGGTGTYELSITQTSSLGSAQNPINMSATFVDVIGIDSYQNSYLSGSQGGTFVSSNQRWLQTAGGNRGIAFWLGFAKQQGVKISFPEWAALSDADAPVFQHMINLIEQNYSPIAYSGQWSTNSAFSGETFSPGANLITTPLTPSAQSITLHTGGGYLLHCPPVTGCSYTLSAGGTNPSAYPATPLVATPGNNQVFVIGSQFEGALSSTGVLTVTAYGGNTPAQITGTITIGDALSTLGFQVGVMGYITAGVLTLTSNPVQFGNSTPSYTPSLTNNVATYYAGIYGPGIPDGTYVVSGSGNSYVLNTSFTLGSAQSPIPISGSLPTGITVTAQLTNTSASGATGGTGTYSTNMTSVAPGFISSARYMASLPPGLVGTTVLLTPNGSPVGGFFGPALYPQCAKVLTQAASTMPIAWTSNTP